ncbi:MAG: ABC transporter substrate-binding protein [Actinomycetes bacterium]
MSGCSLGDSGLLIGATNFTESRIVAQMYALVLSNAGVPAAVKELSGREIVEPALEKGQLQITPDYLATFTTFLNAKVNGPNSTTPASNDVAATYAAAQQLAGPRGLTVLTPSAAQDQNAFAVLPEYAAANKLVTLSQLGPFSQTHAVTLGAGPDCPTRPYCQPGLQTTYGVKFAGFVSLDTGGPLTVKALQQGVIQLGLVLSSSGLVAANNLVVLVDDKHLQPADNVVPVVKTSVNTPQITELLNAVSAKLTTKDLQYLNAQVDIERKDPRDVASAWLTSVGLL